MVSRSILVVLPFLLKFAEINVTFLVSLFGIFQSRDSFLKMCSRNSDNHYIFKAQTLQNVALVHAAGSLEEKHHLLPQTKRF